MRTLGQVNQRLRQYNRKNYVLLFGSCFFSALLITAYVTMMRSPTVLNVLPEGGDSRKQVVAIFALAAVGCVVFVSYTAALFLKYRSREVGILMALGASKRQVQGELFRDLLSVGVSSCVLGALFGTPLAYGIWQIFRRFIIDSNEMLFRFAPQAYGFAGVFLAVVVLILLVMGIRFVNRTNIIDIVNEQRKTETVPNVKSWFGWVGIFLTAFGALAWYLLPVICIRNLHWYPPAIMDVLTIAPMFVGIYMLLLHTVVCGWRKRKNRYHDIITRSIMKFQGRQTVNNMLVITVLVVGAYFASFYAPMLNTGMMMEIEERPTDYLFRYRMDQDMITWEEIQALAAKYGVEITDHHQEQFANLAVDGQEYVEDKGGKYHYEYAEVYGEGNYMPASAYEAITGQSVEIAKGTYKGVISPGGFGKELLSTDPTKVMNPVTKASLACVFDGYLEDTMLATHYYVMNDEDYMEITRGITDDWLESLVVFNVKDVYGTYDFGSELYREIVERTGKECIVAEYYDRITKEEAQRRGEEYELEDENQKFLEGYGNYQSTEFRLFWKYAPVFRVVDKNDNHTTLAVFLMLFIFISIICFAAVFVIAYTRCITVAINNRQVYDDLKRLGAGRAYLYSSIKSQIGKIFKAPVIVGTSLMYLLYFLIMYMNDGILSPGELAGMRNCGILVAAMTLAIWGFYRMTLRKVCRILL